MSTVSVLKICMTVWTLVPCPKRELIFSNYDSSYVLLKRGLKSLIELKILIMSKCVVLL